MLGQDKIANTQVGFNASFEAEMLRLQSQTDLNWEQLVTIIDTEFPSEQFNWLGASPAFVEWIGDRKLSKLANKNYTIAVKDWANGIEVSKNDLDDDRLGMYPPRIAALAKRAIAHRMNRIAAYFIAGFGSTLGTAYDGLNFFSASHTDGGATWSNLVTGTLDDSGAFDGAYQKMLELKDENGDPLNLVPTHLLCGPSNRANARTLLVAERASSGATNTNFGVVTPIISPLITDGKWALLCLSEPVKPFIFLRRQEVTFDQVTQGMDMFLRKSLFFGASARYEVGFGMPQMAIGSDAST